MEKKVLDKKRRKEKIYCFDFDGTLTKKDTLIEFIKYTCGANRFLMVFLLYSPILVLMKLHLFPNWKAKQMIFNHFFGGMTIEDFDDCCIQFAANNLYLLRFDGIKRIQEAQRNKERVFVVSASIDNWVRPFFAFQMLANVEVLGTQIEVIDGIVTGRFKTNNCYGEEKVHRIIDALTKTIDKGKGSTTLDFNRTKYEIEAFGDSRGDKEMLAFADKGHYKPFRESHKKPGTSFTDKSGKI